MTKRLVRIWAAGALLGAWLACNLPAAPSAPPAETAVTLPGRASVAAPTDAPAQATATSALPDIAGTVTAQGGQPPEDQGSSEGLIVGAIRYPSEGNPALDIYALRTDGQYYQYVITAPNQTIYTISLPPGDYFVLADIPNSEVEGFEGAYTFLGQCLVVHQENYEG